MSKSEITQFIKQEVKSVGFEFVGIAKAEKLDLEARQLEKWLQSNYNGKMSYMEKWFDKRIDPRLLVPGAKSVICMLFNYMPKENTKTDSYKIAKYAYGNDYHDVLKSKLATVLINIRSKIGGFDARIFVDSAPVMERTWAKRAGLGWQGKHTLLIHKKRGSYFFIATIICDLDLEYDTPFTSDHCGSCTRCIDACPTGAIIENNILDASKCISYLTIELKDEIPQDFRGKLDDWIFGCDICQDVCPWNSFAIAHSESAFEPDDVLLSMQKKDWEEITEDVFKALFKHTPIQRTKWRGLRRNIDFLQS